VNRLLKNIESKLRNIGSNILNYIQALEEDYRQRMETPTACCHCQEIHLYQDLLPTWSTSLREGSDRTLYRQVWKRPWPGERVSPHSHCHICCESIHEENKRILEATRQEQIRQERLVTGYRREANAVKRHNERAIEAGCQATLTITQWINTLDYYEWRCAYCEGPYEELEHRIPIILGGGTIAINCVPSCRPCNRTKSMKHPDKIIETSLSPEAHRRINTQMEALHGKHSQELLAENLTRQSD
jgi:hypothetical protein